MLMAGLVSNLGTAAESFGFGGLIVDRRPPISIYRENDRRRWNSTIP
jgi:hypothetical protein